MVGLDWEGWHEAYDDPSSGLSLRLLVVRRLLGEALDLLGNRCERVLSLCSGDGRDVLPELAARPDARPETLLVELGPSLAEAARGRATDLGLQDVNVVTGDAGDPATFGHHLPVDLLILCGIFGNIVDADIRATLQASTSMLREGGLVIWTRGWFERGDLRPEVRRWSEDAGLTEVAYDGEPAKHGVGLYRLDHPTSAAALPSRLFTFVR